MALRSMTGHGRGEASADGVKMVVELSSVNHRQFDARLDLPPHMAAMESQLREQIHAAVARGAVTCRVLADASAGAPSGVVINEKLAAHYVQHLRKLGRQLKLADNLGIEHLLQIPELVQPAGPMEQARTMTPLLERAIKQAIKGLLTARDREGSALEKDIRKRITLMQKLLDKISARAPEVAKKYRQTLMTRLEAAGVPVPLDDERLRKEIAIFADRCDISEEITRLRSHFEQALGHFTSKEPVGRTLDFLIQEMSREINTIGSKANDSEISAHVVQAKAELERMREQIQNIE